MSILSGYKKFKKYIKTSSGFQLQSLWTSANTVEADDKRTIQTKVGAINGISSSETANSAEIAASTALTNKMNGTINNLSRDLNAINDSGAIKGMDAREDGVYITYSTGADTVTKKLGDIITREVTGHCGNFHPNYPERSILIDIPAISGYEYFDCAIKECYFENSNGAQKSIRFKIEKYGASKIRVFPGKDSVWTSGGVSATATVMIFYK